MTHKDHIKKVFSAILRNLINSRIGYGEEDISFWPQEHPAIEYYLKDVAKRAITNEMSPSECLHVLKSRIIRMIDGDEYEWERLFEVIRENSNLFKKEELIDFDKIYKHCTKKNKIIV